MRTLLIDTDSECYAAAAAAEKRRVIGYQEQGRFLGPFDTKRELSAALKEGDSCVPFQSREVNTEEAACLLLDARLRRIVYQAQEKYGEVKPELYVSGKINFRHLVDAAYKGNRDNTDRPYWLSRLRAHAMAHWKARMTTTWEADDEIGMRATELGPSNYVIASVDKDLRQVPGDHIVIGKGHLHMTERGAMMRFYCQVLAGDMTDNIRGCWQVGYDGAFTYLEPFIDGGETALWTAVVAKYQASLDKYGPDKCRYFNAHGAALHTAQLVYILRDRPAGNLPPRWRPPTERET